MGYWCAAVTSDAVDARPRQHVDPHPVLVDRDGHRLEAPRADDLAVLGHERVLHREPPGTPRGERAATSPRPCANPDAMTTSAGWAAVPRTRLRYARARPAARARRGRRDTTGGRAGPPQRPPERPDPCAPRELGHVGPTGPEVERRVSGSRSRAARRGRPVGHPGRAPGAGHEIALGHELFVRLDDDPPRHAQLVREARDDGTARAALEPPVADRLVRSAASELPVQGFGRCAVERE